MIGSFGSHVSYLYPTSLLAGEGARSEFTGITFAGIGQNLDTGAKVVHSALCCNLFAHVVINQLRIVLCADARQGGTLCIRDAQCFKRIFDIGRNLGPFRTHLRVGAYIGNNLVRGSSAKN